ncbi:TetR/AcrR family transcriptional regulator [Pseudonocardiaceae bacterium YIM PH 21723]|nr:TetR/AcrR family transcriptional regulator [Pseudonocardiaceae bacterium YIM PH 21723]
MARPKVHDDALRVRLLELTGAMLAAEGPHSLSLRKLATEAGTSTTAIYSLFGGKPGLLAAVHREAFRRFGETLATAPSSDDPVADLLAIGLAYREYAITNPNFYEIMFTKPISDFEPEPEAKAEADATFQVLVDGVDRCRETGLELATDALTAAIMLWGNVHGLVSLELAGVYPPGIDPAATYRSALMAQSRALTILA